MQICHFTKAEWQYTWKINKFFIESYGEIAFGSESDAVSMSQIRYLLEKETYKYGNIKERELAKYIQIITMDMKL